MWSLPWVAGALAVGENEGMSTPELAPHSSVWGVVSVWIAALLAGIAIALFVPVEWWVAWFILAFAAAVLASFGVQLASGHPAGFIQRVGASSVGSLIVLGVVSAIASVPALLAV